MSGGVFYLNSLKGSLLMNTNIFAMNKITTSMENITTILSSIGGCFYFFGSQNTYIYIWNNMFLFNEAKQGINR